MNLPSRKSSLDTDFDKVNALVAAVIFLFTFSVYFLTKAPTLSFWDCGEFIASAYTLGIPHPPGTPLYIILGRLFSMLPITADIAVRVNLLSLISSATAALFGYLILVRMLRYWISDSTDMAARFLPYFGGAVGALFLAFSNTHWGNSVEAEVYALAIMLMMLIFWLGLKYIETRETAQGFRLTILIAFVAMLSIGVHLTIYIVMPIIALFFILKKDAGPKEWGIISIFILVELYLIFMLSSRPGEIPLYFAALIFLIVFLFHLALAHKVTRNAVITIVLFAATLIPFVLSIIAHIFNGPGSAGRNGSAENLISSVGLILLSIWGIWGLINVKRADKSKEIYRDWLVVVIYSLAPGILTILGLIFRGYYSFLLLSALLLLALGWLLRRMLNWTFLIALVSNSLVILGIWQLLWGILIGTIVLIAVGAVFKEKFWKVGTAFILMAALGFSIHAFIPVRSSQNPTLDMNKPSRSLAATIGFLERKQYGSENMIERMFVRRGTWENQFGDYQRMGFWRFFKEQYGFGQISFFIIFVLGLFGFWEMIRCRPQIGLPFLLLFLISSIGIVLYMNFADGTRQNPVTQLDYLEVRNRDYFFTPAFVFFGLAIGLGMAGVVNLFRDSFRDGGKSARVATVAFTTILLVTPIIPLRANYFINDRSRNFIPYDYARNYLESCDSDAILFTNGDNDTFPLWCLQEVYGIRKDVRIVNLSLANTSWYVSQLRDRMNVPIAWSTETIEKLRPYLASDGYPMRIQDQVMEHIITTNNWRKPLFMTTTVPQDSRRLGGQALDEHLILEGMVYRVDATKGKDRVNLERTRRLLLEVYQYRGINDQKIYKDENTIRLTGNYAQGFLALANEMRIKGDLAAALEYLRAGQAAIPFSPELHINGVRLLVEMGRDDSVEKYIEDSPYMEKERMYHMWAITLKNVGKVAEAISILEKVHTLYPDYIDGYRALVSHYYQYRYFSRLRETVSDWVSRHPEDVESQRLLGEIQKLDPAFDTIEGVR